MTNTTGFYDNGDFLNTINIHKSEDSMLLLSKKIILPERKIIVEKPMCIALSQYQPDVNGKFGRTFSGIILSR